MKAISVKPDHVLVDAEGNPEAVVLSLKAYRTLIRYVDDQDDARALKHAIRTSSGTISHTALLKRLKRQGLL